MGTTFKYAWQAFSDDGAFEDESNRWFRTEEDAYEDMRNSALEKMKWNTLWCDVDEHDTLGYEVHFSKKEITHTSYSGKYTYRIISKIFTVDLHERTWQIEDTFNPNEEEDWKVCAFDGIGEMWMNNADGYVILIEPNGRILKSYI